MFAIDTNVLVRYITQDGDEAPAVTKHLEREASDDHPAFIGVVVLCELVWVLGRAYKYTRSDICSILEYILMTSCFEVEQSDRVWKALQTYRSDAADFSDYLIGVTARSYDAAPVHTLDRKAARHSDFLLIA